MTQQRAVIYARYSSDLQREASIEDQVEICRRYCETMGWKLSNTYTDAAISGASRHRPAYQAMLSDARLRKFDVVICEAVDRLGRRLADTADLQDTLAFLGIRLFTPAMGELTAIHIGIMGMMAQLTLKDIGEKTKRGQIGRVKKGKAAGGLAYGYRAVTGDDGGRGHRQVDANEASIVVRIFREFAAGRAPELIAKDLNAERVVGPGGRPWSNTTIRGQARRGTGILNNTTYIGELEWNRCSYVKDPATGKRVARPNAPEKWERSSVPTLRIVDDELWNAAKDRQNRIRHSLRGQAGVKSGASRQDLNATHRPTFLLSGLLKCGECGGNYIIMGKDRFGCSTRRRKGTCNCTLSITRRSIEDRVLRGLKDRLVTPELAAAFVAEFQAEYERKRSETQSRQAISQRRISDIERKIKSMMQAIEDGFYAPEMKKRLADLNEERANLQDNAQEKPAGEIVLHPRMHEFYRRKIAELEGLVAGDDELALAARETIRTMITRVTISPAEGETEYHAVLEGDLAAILVACQSTDKSSVSPKSQLPGSGLPGSQLSVVAGAGCHLHRTRLVWERGGSRMRNEVTTTSQG